MANPFRRRLPARLRRLQTDNQPFMASFSLLAARDAETIDLSKYAGLVVVHVCANSDAPRLISYWKSREDFERSGAILRDDVQGADEAVGYVVHYQEPYRSLIKRMPWYTLFVTALAIVGAIDTIRNQSARLAGKPDVRTSWRNAQDFKYELGEPILHVLAVTNRRAVTQKVAISEVTLTSADGVPTEYRVSHPPGIVEIPENQTEELEFRVDVTRPGMYRLAGKLEVRAGRFARSDTENFVREVEVWDPDPQVGAFRVERQKDDACELAAELRLGKAVPSGILCNVRIDRHPELEDVYPSLPSPIESPASRDWNVHGPPGAEVGSGTFVLEPIQAMKPATLFLELIVKGRANCERLRAATRVKCKQYREEPNHDSTRARPSS